MSRRSLLPACACLLAQPRKQNRLVSRLSRAIQVGYRSVGPVPCGRLSCTEWPHQRLGYVAERPVADGA
jgi:hypothetical protein